MIVGARASGTWGRGLYQRQKAPCAANMRAVRESRVVLSEYYEGIVINGKYICYGHIQYDGGPTCVFSFYSII